jgi:hypothetical protein
MSDRTVLSPLPMYSWGEGQGEGPYSNVEKYSHIPKLPLTHRAETSGRGQGVLSPWVHRERAKDHGVY